MRKITEQEWAELQTKYPAPAYELVKLELRLGDIVIRNPTEQEHGTFMAMRVDDTNKRNAFPNLLLVTSVFPAREEMIADMRRYPGLAGNPKVLKGLMYVAGEADSLEGKG